MAGIRRVVATVAVFVALLQVALLTAYGGFTGYGYARTLRFVTDQVLHAAAELKGSGVGNAYLTPETLGLLVQAGNWSNPALWTCIGAALGFAVSCTMVAMLFALHEIAQQSRRTADRLDALGIAGASRALPVQ